MRHLAASLLLTGCLGIGVTASAAQTGDAGSKPIRACSLLTKELALKVTSAANKKVFDLIPPSEEPLGATGSACEYGDIGLQVDPFTPARFEELRKEWMPVAGVGDRAYFRDNRGNFSELVVVVGARTLTIQMGVPTGGTAEGIKPNVITLANALVPRLR